MGYNEQCLKYMNIPEWWDFLKKYCNDVKLRVGVWGADSIEHPDHEINSYKLIRHVIGKDQGLLPNVELIPIIVDGMRIPQQCKDWVDMNSFIVNASWVGADLKWYAKQHKDVQIFLDKILLVNSAGNDGPNKVSHPGKPKLEWLIGACRFDQRKTPPITWYGGTNHEEGFVEDINCLSWFDVHNGPYGYTSGAAPVATSIATIMTCVFNALKGYYPNQQQIDDMTINNYYVEFESERGTKRLAVMPKIKEFFNMKIVKLVFTQNSPDYLLIVDGKETSKTITGYDKPGDGLPAPEIPVIMNGGVTLIPPSIEMEALNMLKGGIFHGVTKQWNYEKKQAIFTYKAEMPAI